MDYVINRNCESRDDELIHYGVLGMKWGIRRYTNADGSLTDAGKKREARLSEKTRKLVRKSIDNSSQAKTYATQRINGSQYMTRSNKYMNRAIKTAEKMSDEGKKAKRSVEFKHMTAENLSAAEYYVKRTAKEKALSSVASATISTGASFVAMAVGVPVGVLFVNPGPDYKLKD